VPATALQHFREDIGRARSIVSHADSLPDGTPGQRLLQVDLWRSAWVLAVGAFDAYFCDAYTDIIAATAGSESRQPLIALPEWAYEIRVPLRAVLQEYGNSNWRWRMAARKLMERESVISLSAMQSLFNKFFRIGHKLFRDVLDGWICHPDAITRLFGVSTPRYSAMTDAEKRQARGAASDLLEQRFRRIFQRRHDCVHNCDRPRRSPQSLGSADIVLRVIQDIDFLVRRCDEHIEAEFRQFLVEIGCSTATIAQAGY
jgi:hypothetical protein